ncbi:PTS system sorbose subfamily IIB component [Coriobacterium glomerans PW2]|uniref:PTS system sorbose subfamily IIB component n=1 Tax=Coriobacterium glomerans (strain ATCC 49209 / DSM 20642 / JCM 10262 / PW2) TaxID=700015 RepID=F2NB59_CORGP|nr:PTS sugar transporter subunit IIB [Coriobacterium glomerans]AEB07810.1 PTS system sorbose subfamily IIB component [Coriobacterium glomerans PW2]
MAIIDTRIDDRLIHGQVCSFWIPEYSLDRIVIVDDAIAQDETRKTALRFGCPERCKLSIFNATKAADKFSQQIDRGTRVMILTGHPQPILAMVQNGFKVDHVTVGNMSTKSNANQIRKTVFVSAEEWQAFHRLALAGIPIFNQMIPTDARENITDLFQSEHC